MQFISIYFIVFFIALLLGYYVCPRKYQYIFILISNLIFYISWINYIGDLFVLAIVILVTAGGAVFLKRCTTRKQSRIVLLITLTVGLGFLVYFKYYNFFFDNFCYFYTILGKKKPTIKNTIIAPVGISFFTFQAIGYLIDVYREKIIPEKNILRYAAFISFFPIITSGPISRADSLLAQMQDTNGKKFSYDNLRKGFTIALYGAFIKLVIADRLSVICDTVFNDYKSYGGFILFFASACYTFQIYCDFSSYSLIAAGISRVLGYDVIENFKAPYLAESIQEFWRRWHISLSTWFRDYVYIPLGGSRCSKKRKNINLFVTFLVSGLWHGANWSFIFWGCLHGLYQIIGNIFMPARKYIINKFNVNTQCFSFHLFKKLFVFMCVSTAWIFFRVDTITDAFSYMYRMISVPDFWDIFNMKIYLLGLDTLQMNILALALVILAVLDYKKYKYDVNIDVLLNRQNFLFRCLFICVLFLFTFVFGMYGPEFIAQDFIYFRF